MLCIHYVPALVFCYESLFILLLLLFIIKHSKQTCSTDSLRFPTVNQFFLVREAPCEGTNSPRLFTPGERAALAK
jgi:hypothetical protein